MGVITIRSANIAARRLACNAGVVDNGGSYTVKKYTSKKKYAPDGAWLHEGIILQPLNPVYSPIVIPTAEDEEFMVVAVVVGKCLPGQ